MTRTPPDSVRIPEDLEPFIAAGIVRTGKTRHGYLLAAIRHVARKETIENRDSK